VSTTARPTAGGESADTAGGDAPLAAAAPAFGSASRGAAQATAPEEYAEGNPVSLSNQSNHEKQSGATSLGLANAPVTAHAADRHARSRAPLR
jgi:hypothetical protein